MWRTFRLACGLAVLCLAAGLWTGRRATAQATSHHNESRPAETHSASSNNDASTRPDIALFRARVQAALAAQQPGQAHWGVLVIDRDTGETLCDVSSGQLFAPASNAKIFTTAFALATLGRSYKYRTTLESVGTLGPGGRLSGDLVFVGRGDPDLSNRKFPHAGKEDRSGAVEKPLADLADAAVSRGLREVDGDLIADDSYFPYDPYPDGWTSGDLFFDFGAPVSAIAFNENTIAVTVQPGAHVGEPAILDVEPNAATGTFGHDVSTVAGDMQADFAVVRQPGSDYLLLRGAMPLGHAPVSLNFAMMDPAETTALALKQLLEDRGVRITGSVVVRHGPPPVRSQTGTLLQAATPAPLPTEANNLILSQHDSPSLLESVRLTNKISQNLHAEIFLRTVAREKTGTGSIDEGLKLEQQFLASVGIADGEVLLSDGSGLARDDLVTPRATVQILRYAMSQPWGKDFFATLPIAGVDGTLENRMKNTPAAGLIEAKTGSTDRVHALSGYATTARGESLVFAIFGNNDAQKAHDASVTVDAIATAMVETLGVSRKQKSK